ncbi:GIY-YIG nuclease superfamily protein [bacterium BMS3Bbin10]|nr:GIY-YIG nuclease superfamily protein [bacterium BMS3Bbin10]
MKRFFVYILASRKNGTLYTGMTNDIARRAWEHRTGAVDGFTRRHSVKRLVYVEELATARDAIRREKTIKGWPRQWKINAIEQDNPEWFDLTRRLNR